MLIEKLKGILFIQLKLMEELCSLLERETPELLSVNIDAIVEINALKESATERINEHTDPLRQTISEIAVSSELPSNATLVEVVTHLGKQGYKEVPALYQDLNTQAKQVRHMAALNHDIAEQSAAMVKNALRILTQLLEQAITYCASGNYEHWQDEGIIIDNDV